MEKFIKMLCVPLSFHDVRCTLKMTMMLDASFRNYHDVSGIVIKKTLCMYLIWETLLWIWNFQGDIICKNMLHTLWQNLREKITFYYTHFYFIWGLLDHMYWTMKKIMSIFQLWILLFLFNFFKIIKKFMCAWVPHVYLC